MDFGNTSCADSHKETEGQTQFLTGSLVMLKRIYTYTSTNKATITINFSIQFNTSLFLSDYQRIIVVCSSSNTIIAEVAQDNCKQAMDKQVNGHLEFHLELYTIRKDLQFL